MIQEGNQRHDFSLGDYIEQVCEILVSVGSKKAFVDGSSLLSKVNLSIRLYFSKKL